MACSGVVDVTPRTSPIELGGCHSCQFRGVVFPQSSIHGLPRPEVSIRLTHLLFDPMVIILRPQLASNSSMEFGVLQPCPELLCDFSFHQESRWQQYSSPGKKCLFFQDHSSMVGFCGGWMGCIRGNAHPGAASSAFDGGATGIAIAPHSSSFATWLNKIRTPKMPWLW